MAEIISKLRLLIIFLTNAGGVGKTHLTEIFECLARLAANSVQVVDCDQDLRGYGRRNGNGAAVELDWEAVGEVEPGAWFEQHLAPVNIGILDLGANFLAFATPAQAFINNIVEMARASGVRTVFLPVEAPDKAGARELSERLFRQFSHNFEVIVVRNDNRGTKAFANPIQLMDPPTLHIEYLQSGFESVRLRQTRRLDEVVTAPEAGYTIASGAIAKRLLGIARDPLVAGLLGSSMLAPLKAAAADAPGSLTYTVSTPAQAKDDKLRANMAVRAAHAALNDPDLVDPQARLAAFEAEREAIRRYLST